MPDPLSSGDLPTREVGFYGGVRSGWEKARSGLEEVIQHLGTLMERDPNNVRLQRYIAQVEKLLDKTHKLHMRISRIRDRQGPQGGPGTTKPSRPWTILKGLDNG